MKKWFVSVLIAALLCTSAGIFAQNGRRLSYAVLPPSGAQTQASTLQETYRLGESFTVPTRTFSTAGGEVPATSVLIAPDGKATVATSVVLDKAGKWTIRYSAKANGKVYSAEESFLVLNNAYSMRDSLSSAAYGKYTQYGANSDGLQVKLSMNDTLTFEKVIDLSNLGVADTLISGFVTPTTRGVADFGRILFTLTDAEDPSVYLQIMGSRYKNSNERGIGITYFAANGNGQYATGIEREDNVHVADGLGTPVEHSFVSQKNNDGWAGPAVDTVPDANTFTVTFDQKELILYVNGAKVVDFDNAAYFEELWFGFPSKKVRLAVSGGLYNAATANFCLTEVYGIDLREELFIDEDAPEITVEVPEEYRSGNAYRMPEGRIGGTYPIPAATATDEISGTCAVDVKVYYNHLSEHPIAVPITNGKFATEGYGDYGIVYTASDVMGNTAQEILNVHVGGDIPELTFTCPENEAVEVGYFAQIKAPTGMQGGSGTLTFSAKATLGSTTLDATHGFIPESAGNWTVEYTVTDYIGTEAKKSSTLNVTSGTKPVLPESIALPPIMIAGAAYTLPMAVAKDYTSGTRVDKICDVEILDASGAPKTYKAGDTFRPEVKGSKEVLTVTYTCGTARSESMSVAVIDPWDHSSLNALNIGAYFYGDGFTTEIDANNNGVIIKATAAGDFAWTFANAQLAENASVRLQSIVGKTDCQAFEIVLTDADNAANSIVMRLRALSANSTQVTVGERTITLNKSFTGNRAQTFEIGYASKRFYIDGTAIDVLTDAVDKPFEGFASDKVFISVRAEGATQSTQYLVGAVSGFAFSTFAYDDQGPTILVLGDRGGTYNAGDVYTIAPAVAGDVYCPVVTLSLTVRDPNGDVVHDVNGVALSGVDASVPYDVVLGAHGQYKVSYTSSEVDWTGMWGDPNTTTFTLMVNVLDSEAPVITFKHDFATTAKVGDTLVIPDFTVTDDVSAADDILVLKYVMNPDGKLIQLTGNSIKCEYAGEYEFRILVRDEAGNTTLYKHTVQVR